MLLTKLLTRSRFRIGDPLGSISGLGWLGIGPSLEISGEGKEVDEKREEEGEGGVFITLLTELPLSRLRRMAGAGSCSRLEEWMGFEELPVSGGRCAGDGLGEANGDAKCFTKLFTLARFR